MNITINSLENISVIGNTATGNVTMTINDKVVKSATYTHDLRNGRTTFRQNAMVDGFDLKASGDHFNVEEYCYACEALQNALQVKTAKFQSYLGLSDVRVYLGETVHDGDTSRCVVLITGYYWVDGERNEIKPLFADYVCGDGEHDLNFFRDQKPIDRLENGKEWVKSYGFKSVAHFEAILKKELLSALSDESVEITQEEEVDIVLCA